MLGYCRNFVLTAVFGLMMFVEDLFPAIKRRKLAKKYSGDELEQRVRVKMFGGLQMFKNIWKLLNSKAMVGVGERVPSELEVYNLTSKKCDKLASLCRPGVPLILNFGSCT